MSITNVTRPSDSMTNSSKPFHEVTWDSNTTTWDTETRTWDEMASIVTNDSRPSTSMINISRP